ncbi:MAG: alcohol dehydrogenase [Chloroflexota bacterium]|nr:alcohol dehydrogenase [Chloroflexota bacterium]
MTAVEATRTAEVARLYGPGDVQLTREAAPSSGPGEVLLEVTAVGLCGSDLHWYRRGGIGDAGLIRPLVLGHEFGGVILAGPRAGERVAADPADPCGRCEPCRRGRTNICIAPRFAGFGTTDGALRSVMPWPSHLLHRVPDAIADDEVALLEPLGVALHALDLAPIAVGARAGVYGCGPLGLLLVQLLRARGASVIVATDRLAHRVAAARALGATHGFVVSAEPDDPAAVGGEARDVPVDVAFEVAGDDAAIADAIAAVKPGGRVALVGIPDDDRSSFPAAAARRKELSFHVCRRMAQTDLPRAIAVAEAGQVDLSALITHRFPLGDASDAFAMLASRHGRKVVVNPALPASDRP